MSRNPKAFRTPLTGAAPSFFVDEGVVYVSHDCATGRNTTALDTTSGFGWTIVRQTDDMLVVGEFVSCTVLGCQTAKEYKCWNTFTKEALA